jgi:hypothetical protein
MSMRHMGSTCRCRQEATPRYVCHIIHQPLPQVSHLPQQLHHIRDTQGHSTAIAVWYQVGGDTRQVGVAEANLHSSSIMK